MSEQFWLTLLGGSLALIGGVVAQLYTANLAARQFDRQLRLEREKRQWEKEDLRSTHELGIIERRCQQAEAFGEAFVATFTQLRESVSYLLPIDDTKEAQATQLKYLEYLQGIDKKTYANRSAIFALGSKAVRQAWEEMESAHEALATQATKVYRAKLRDQEVSIEEVRESVKAIAAIFSDSHGKLLVAIDEVRASIGLSWSSTVSPKETG